jgi:hypothetical protein
MKYAEYAQVPGDLQDKLLKEYEAQEKKNNIFPTILKSRYSATTFYFVCC